MDEYLNQGFTIIKNVFPPDFVRELLNGEPDESSCSLLSTKRARNSVQVWQGVKKQVYTYLKHGRGPLVSRSAGRFDLALPKEPLDGIKKQIEKRGVERFLKLLIPNGKYQATDILLARPGAVRQPVHVDSNWSGRR